MAEQLGDHPDNITALLSHLANEDYCYITTKGRISGRLHKIEIWFAFLNNSLYLLSGEGDRSDWVKNLRAHPVVTVRIAEHTFTGVARAVKDEQEDALSRRLLAAKYQSWREGQSLSDWARTALPVAIDFHQGK